MTTTPLTITPLHDSVSGVIVSGVLIMTALEV
jgi:hypothetical protein